MNNTLQITTGKADGLFFVVGEQLLPIDTMYDIGGDETDDPDKATALVVLLPDNRWLPIHCSPRDIQRRKLN